ncbi:hypothetical protein [Pseudarthrobacter sp. PH31-O2]|uniref:hypothetical protein n=1 Tax=Pseudarthrobacter sp. PH31-O2 TaxID=3046206 RepID=UPI0024B9139B|nr:hypothetical protein [Pseudarthrobacter sp. PH31-O2]MDJ0352731.1 hypothetical protein [Pseudarthrobacter sp. PH31-O2]
MEGPGREIEPVTGNDSSRLKDQGLKAKKTSAPDYGTAERQEAFAASLASAMANQTQVGGGAAERNEGTHPSASLAMGKGAAKAKKVRTDGAVGSERN